MFSVKVDLQEVGNMVADHICNVLDDLQDKADAVAEAKAKTARRESYTIFEQETGFPVYEAKQAIECKRCPHVSYEVVSGHQVLFCNPLGKYLSKCDSCPMCN